MTFREKVKRIFGRHSSVGSHGHGQKPEDKPHPAAQTRPATAGPGGNNNNNNNNIGQAAVGKAVPSPKPRPPPGTKQSRFAGAKARTPKLGKDGNPKIEVYKAHQVPPSKFRGPFDPTHMRNMAEYTIAQEGHDRPLSMLSNLSPTESREPAPWDVVVGPADDEAVSPERRADMDPATPGQFTADQTQDRSSERAYYDGDSRSSYTLIQPPSNDAYTLVQPPSNDAGHHKAEQRQELEIHFTEPFYPSNGLFLPTDTPTPPPAKGGPRPALPAVNVQA